uniref:Uncharacterized protein n=1 Tax=Rhizophora mucronata TaxID=61149 RepID=A0A2P2J5W4_RHIMU
MFVCQSYLNSCYDTNAFFMIDDKRLEKCELCNT